MTTNNANLAREYRKARAAYPGIDAYNAHRIALTALRRARLQMNNLFPDFGHSFFGGESRDIELPNGYNVRVEIYNDIDGLRWGEDDCTPALEWISRRNDTPRHYGAPDPWTDTRNDTLHARNYRGDDYTLTHPYGLAERIKDNRARGMARGPAYQAACNDLRANLEHYARLVDDGSQAYGVGVTLLDANGYEINDESCWGFEDEEGALDFIQETIPGMLKEAADHCAQVRADAAQTAANARAQVRALNRERAQVRTAGETPTLCEMFRQTARQARATWCAARATLATHAEPMPTA